MEQERILTLRDVTISHDMGVVLKDVNFSMSKGEFVYLIGKSGAGKTSLLRALYADNMTLQGSADVCGFDVVSIKRRQIPILRRKLGIVFQNFQLLTDRNVYDNLSFVLRSIGWKDRKKIDERIMEVLTSVGVADKATYQTFRLSEGERQRVGIARALVNTPDLILADEPTGNLDPITSSEIMHLLTEINHNLGVTMLISTHDFMMIDKFPARVVCCEDGTLVDPQIDESAQ
ncbi:MAG: ATP-binding cassette domain-containing protein [Bacteroidales bacterium]|nr:ATP-binding cassette domain-containing protein [Bacteroidales bacterium]